MRIYKLLFSLAKMESWPTHIKLEKFQIHRGYWVGGKRENSLEAFREAQLKGAKCVETDVRLIQGQLVLLHDNDPSQIRESELFEDLLKDQNLKLNYNIELKSEKIFDSISRKSCDLIKKYNFESRIFFSSFNPFCLCFAAKCMPQIPRALLVAKKPSLQWYLATIICLPWFKIHMFNLQDELVTEELARFLNQKKIPFSVWTVNTPERAHELLRWGAQSIISDTLVY